ncbi:MAG: hypothetical protein QG612_176 [Pseudomonadota bacterium]|nr:hypothetical protein [Pseudomonadota bacterium]
MYGKGPDPARTRPHGPGVKVAETATDIEGMDRSAAPSPVDFRLLHVLADTPCGALLLVTPARLEETVAVLGATLREAVLQAADARLAQVVERTPGVAGPHRRGDGFALVVDSSRTHDPIDALVSQLLDALEAPVDVAGQRFSLGGWAGRADFATDGPREPATLLRQADLAGLSARRLGRGHGVRHTPEITMAAVRRLRAEDTLHRTIDQAAIDLRFEIQADMCTGALTGAVVLPRWTPALIGVSDGASGLSALAAQAGLLHRLAEKMLLATCRQVRQWRDQGLDVPGMSLELPSGLWEDRALVSIVLDALVDQGLPGGTLTLLLDAPALSGDGERLRTTLRALRATGLRIGLARFGQTEPLSLGLLGLLPLDELTLDAPLLDRLGQRDGARMAAALVAMARALGLRIVAGGVRSDAQLDFLRRHHCDEFQGPLLSRPISATTMTQVLMHARVQHRVVMDTPTGPGTGSGSPPLSGPGGGPAHPLTAAAG